MNSKTYPISSTTRSSLFQIKSLLALVSLLAVSPLASAADFYWGQTVLNSGTYKDTVSTGTNWFSDAAGNTALTGTFPGSLEHNVLFNTTSANTIGGTIVVDTPLTANSLTFNTSGNTTLAQNQNRSLYLGSGGVTLGASSGNVNIGVSSPGSLSVLLVDNQTWTNNSTNLLTVRTLTTGIKSGSEPATLTLNAASSGGINFSTNITDTTADPLAVVIDSAGSGGIAFYGTGNTYRGGTIIQRGVLSAYGSLGSGDIMLGGTSGSSNATLIARSSTFTNNIIVRAGSSGTNTLTTNQTGGVKLTGSLTLNNALMINTATSGTLAGAISGTGSIVKIGASTLVLTGADTASGNLTITAGAFTLADTASLTFTIGDNHMNNQILGATAGLVSLNGTFNFDLSEAALVDGNSWTIVNVSNEVYGDSFNIAGFTQINNEWTNNEGFTFRESDGMLSYAVPEPSVSVFLIGALIGVLGFRNCRQNRASARL